MHRFFVNKDQIEDAFIRISGEDHHHLTHVLRIRDNEVFEVCNGEGTDYHCVIAEDDGKTVFCQILQTQPSLGESDIAYTLFQGLPKGTKMDEVVQKNTELGISRIVPFESMRTVVDLKGKQEKKTERWQKIALSAAKQSKRGVIPEVSAPVTFNEVVSAVRDYDLFVLCYEEERATTLKSTLEKLKNRPGRVAFLIGPEGGLDPSEAETLSKAGALSVSLGHRILRTETAGQSVLSQLNFFFGESADE